MFKQKKNIAVPYNLFHLISFIIIIAFTCDINVTIIIIIINIIISIIIINQEQVTKSIGREFYDIVQVRELEDNIAVFS